MDCVPLGWGGIQYIDGREGRYETAIHTILAALKDKSSVSTQNTDLLWKTTQGFEPRNPYKGLRAFTGADAPDFFGRMSLVKELTEALQGVLIREQQGIISERLLAVLGASGSGKSSVVMAGLLPCLRTGELPGSTEWIYLDPIVPGIHPIESLTLTLSALLPEKSLKVIREDLEDEAARGLHLHASALTKRQGGQGRRMILIVDQFEELFTLTTTEEERRHFIDLLVTAITEPHGPVIAVLTLRADFSDRPMSYPELYRLIDAHHCSVLPMNQGELRAVIEQPALLPDVQLTFEGDLVGDLLFEVQEQVGALPLLEFTLDQLFQQRKDRMLTLEEYQRMGGVRGALVTHAESTYAALSSEELRKATRALFLRLIDPGETEQDTTRRRAALSELSLPDAKQTSIMQEATGAFIAARLLTTNEVAGVTTVEVSHEALIREWTRLADWVRTGREDVRLQQAISEDADQWEQHDKPGDRLYRGSQLEDARAWATRNMASGKEMAFLQACTDYQKRVHTRTTAGIIAIALLVVLITGLIGQIVFSRQPDFTHVTTINDTGAGSLRQAIELAHNGSIIRFEKSLRGTIPLNENLNIGKNLTIIGPGANMLAISSGSRGYSIQVDEGATVTIEDLAFKDSTIVDAYPFPLSSLINNFGKLTLKNCIISGNASIGKKDSFSVGSGGGITNYGMLSLIGSTVSHNTAAGGPTFQVDGYSGNGGSGGGISNNGTLTLTESIVSNNLAAAGVGATKGNFNGGGSGGGISNNGTLTLTNSVVSHNTAGGGNDIKIGSSYIYDIGGNGGGISNSGTLALTNSTISDNNALGGIGDSNGGGGGISSIGSSYSMIKAETKISNSSISGNIASGWGSKSGGCGGGIFNRASILTIVSSAVTGNTTSGGIVGDDNPKSYYLPSNSPCNSPSGLNVGSGGGGIANFGDSDSGNISSNGSGYSPGTLTIVNSTIAGNTAASSGGGIIDWSSKTSITFCTLYENKAISGSGIAAETGHYIDYSGNNSTLKSLPGHVQLRNSIVADGHTQHGPVVVGQVTSGGYNLLEENSDAKRTLHQQHSTDILVKNLAQVFGVNPILQEDLGSTKTYALLPDTGDPALDKIPLTACHSNNITTDQRGVKRPEGNKTKCDIGAYEVD